MSEQSSSLQVAEAEAAAVATAPRVSLASMEAKIVARYDLTGEDIAAVAVVRVGGPNMGPPPLDIHPESIRLLSICILVMTNGFSVIGHSAPASAANYDRALGHKLAYENAIRQLWPLEGYALREQLSQPRSNA